MLFILNFNKLCKETQQLPSVICLKYTLLYLHVGLDRSHGRSIWYGWEMQQSHLYNLHFSNDMYFIKMTNRFYIPIQPEQYCNPVVLLMSWINRLPKYLWNINHYVNIYLCILYSTQSTVIQIVSIYILSL